MHSHHPMKVLHLLGELKPSGAEVMLCLAAPVWQRCGVELYALSTGLEPGPYAEKLQTAGYRIIHHPFKRGPGMLAWARSFLQILKRERIDVVHIHSERNSALTTVLPRMLGLGICRTIHNNFPFAGIMAIQKRIERFLSRALGCTQIAISKSVQQNELSRLGNPSTLCWNWFDDAHFRPPTPEERISARAGLNLAEGDFILVSVGNGNDIKNYPAIIEALAGREEKAETLKTEKLKEEPQITQISQMKEVDRAVPGAMGSPNAQSASFFKTRLTGLEGDGGRGSARAEGWPQKGAESTKNLEGGEEPQITQISQIDDKGRDVRPARPGNGEPRIARSSQIEVDGETGVEGCSRTRERLEQETLDPDQNLTISATEVGQTLLRRARLLLAVSHDSRRLRS
jgi:hypothetical protein